MPDFLNPPYFGTPEDNGGGEAPSGPAGGDLGGTYPNPKVLRSPTASATVLHTNGTSTAYAPAADTNAERGAALLAAKAAAVSGESITSGAGTFDVFGLQKTGVSFDLFSASIAHISTGTNVDTLFTDTGGAIVMRIDAGAVNPTGAALAPTTQTGLVVDLTNAGSVVNFSARSVTDTSAEINDVPFSTAAGILNVTVPRIVVKNGTKGAVAWWGNGDMTLNGDYCEGGLWGIMARVQAGATMTGKLWVNEKVIVSNNYPPIDVRSSNGETGSAQIWVVGNSEIRGGVIGGCINQSGCKLYVISQKLTNTVVGAPAITISSGEQWTLAQKIQGLVFVSLGGLLNLMVHEWQDNLGDTDHAFDHQGGDVRITAGTMKAVTANGFYTEGGGGSLTIMGGVYDFSAVAAANPVRLYDDTTVFTCVGNPRFIAHAGQACVVSDIGNTVTVFGHFIANTAIGANVVAHAGYTLDDGTNVTEYLPASTVAQGVSVGYVAKTGTYTALVSDYTINCTSGTFTVTVPTAIGMAGKMYIVKNSGAGVITIAGTSAQTFDGAANLTISLQYNSYKIQSNGANWIVI